MAAAITPNIGTSVTPHAMTASAATPPVATTNRVRSIASR